MNTAFDMYTERDSTPTIETGQSKQRVAAWDLKFDHEAILKGNRYRAKVAFVSPQSKRSTFESENECFLGVSLENRNFTPNRFYSLVEWVSRRFSKCKVLIGDSIHRITLETTQGLAPATALLRATELGEKFMIDHQHLLESYKNSTTFEYVTCGSIQDSEEYIALFAAIECYFDTHPAFRTSVEEFGRNYHRRDWDNLSDEERALHLHRSSQYFLEEFAVFACLAKGGTNVMVYPGSFSTLAEVANGDFPGILSELQTLTVVSLTMKRR